MLALARKAQRFSSVTAVYGVTLLALWLGLKPFVPALDFGAEPMPSASIYLPDKRVPPPTKKVISGTPVAVSVPAVNIDKEIVPGIYDKQARTWQVLPRSIHFAEASNLINDHAGNTLLYAHNNRHAFGPLARLQLEDTAQVITDTNYLFSYRLVRISDHNPSDTSIFAYRGDPILTLMTCSGAFNEIRSFYTFQLEAVEKL